jgi:serine/threonine protein kinase
VTSPAAGAPATAWTPILLVTAGDASLASFKRLEHEYALKAELDSAWAAWPVGLSSHNDRMTLALEDPAGEPLDRLLGRPLALSEFLHIAIAFARALFRVHERGLVHKDIKPANVRPRGGRSCRPLCVLRRLFPDFLQH